MTDSRGISPVLDAWAEDAGVQFLTHPYGEYTAGTVSRQALESLIASVLMAGLERGKQQGASVDVWRAAAHEAAATSRHMHDRNGALLLLISDMGQIMARMGAGIDHLSKIAREWEPDHSSGADRAGWVRATDAARDAQRLMADIPNRLKATP